MRVPSLKNTVTLPSDQRNASRIQRIVVGTIILAEVLLRLVFGLGDPVLVQADPDTGYRFQPNQNVFRLGKRVEYNQYSQRSEPISLKKPQGTLRILMIGDSVLNGGNPTDQPQTITELVEDQLSTSGLPVEVLNASAGSWGIGNQLGYLQKFGTFGSDAVILQIGTHDLTQPTSTSAPVGRDPNYPTSPPLFAIQEVWIRYAWPQLQQRLPISSTVVTPGTVPQNRDQQFSENLQKIKAIATLTRAQQIPSLSFSLPIATICFPPE